MTTRSIHWRLPLSYAAIALLAALTLGAVLLLTLQTYYRNLERNYLYTNAQVIGREVGVTLANGAPQTALKAQMQGFAFLTQTRLRLLDPQGILLVDTASLPAGENEIRISVQTISGGVSQTFSQALAENAVQQTFQSTILIQDENSAERMQIQRGRTSPSGTVSQLPVAGTLFGFGLGDTEQTIQNASAMSVRWPVHDELTGTLVGSIEISEGPAYGRQILSSVARGWIIAGIVAVVLSGAAGGLISRRLTHPLLDLTGAAERMIAGDLSARAAVFRRDEIGALAIAFNRMAQSLAEMILSLRRFIADAAHELHTPLTVLQSDLELMGGEAENDSQATRIRRSADQVARLMHLTRSLLALSQAEAQTGPSMRIDLVKIARSSGERAASRAEQLGLQVTFDLPEASLWVTGDAAGLERVMDNLLDNALKFTPSGGQVHMELKASSTQVQVTVSDTGIGIPQEELRHLFERFWRAPNAAPYPGSGLGLAIVHAIITRHNGLVEVTSGNGGTAVKFSLPAVENP